MNKGGKFPFGLIVGIVLMFVVIGVAIALMSFTLGNIQDTQTANSTEYNATGDVLDGVEIMSSLMPGIGVVVGVAVFIIIIVFAFKNLAMR